MLASLLRTLVPLLVAWAGPTLTAWAGWTPEDISLVAGLLVAGGYYAVVRLLERYVSPRFGWLLGLASAPSYSRAGDVEIPLTVTSGMLDFDRTVRESRRDPDQLT
jgi:hypothetical protein